MRSISAAIIILAAAILVTGGAHVPNGGLQGFLVYTGCTVGLIGLGSWFATFKEK
jgi:multisubunit Na+/H+ antiporter MnhB subunit